MLRTRSTNEPVLGEEDGVSTVGESSKGRALMLLPRKSDLVAVSMTSVGWREKFVLGEAVKAGTGDGDEALRLPGVGVRMLEVDKGGVAIGGEGFGI